MGASISIYLDTRVQKPDKVYPVKIRATHGRQRIYIGIKKARVNIILSNSRLEKFRYDGVGNFSMEEEVFKKVLNPKVTGLLKEMQIILKGIELDAQKIADSINPFTLDAFKTRMNKARSKKNQVFSQFDELIAELKASDRIGTAISYQCASTSLKKFTGGKEVIFEYFTKSKLEQYKTWMQSGDNTCSDTTIGIYLRALRTLFNRAKDNEITTHYPFSKGKEGFKIPKGKGRKIALNKAELQQIFDYSLGEKHSYSFFLDMWKLMYLLGGINPIDLCLLKENNIKNGFIYYYRHKTKLTSNEPKEIQVPYSLSVKSIIDKWKIPEKKDLYLIPVLDDTMNATKRKAEIAQFVKMVNTAMKHIGEDLKFEQRITCYVARHSIATQLLRSGASVKFIGDQLGHHDTKTTEQYLGGFEDEQIKEAFNLATNF